MNNHTGYQGSGPINVVFLTSSYPRTRGDTASVFLKHLAAHLQKLNIKIHVLAPSDAQAAESEHDGVIIQRFRYLPRRWERLAYGSGILSNLKRNPLLYFQVPFFIMGMAFALIRHVRKNRPQIIHAHWIIPQGFIAIIAKFMYKIPVIITAHGADSFALRGRMLRIIKSFCLHRCDAWTSNTNVTAGSVSLDSLPSPHIIPMGVEVEHFASGSRERLRRNLRPNEFILLFAGRLVEKKGVEDLLRAFAMLNKSLKDMARLWIVGDGSLMSSLQELATALGVRDKTEFFGSVPNHRLRDYYAAADLFVGPSIVAESGDTEGQGVVFIEAFAAGLCVIATRVGGIPEVVDDGRTGILVSPGSPAELAAAVQRLFSDPALRQRLAHNARDEARRIYSWPTIAEEFSNLYQNISTKP